MVRYCPDNTCESFTGAKQSDAGDVADFALLYLWRVSDYTYLSSWRERPMPAALRDVLGRHERACRLGSEGEMTACTLRRLAQTSNLGVSLVRYDEGRANEERVDLEQELGRLK
jgi:hypothetical protein